MNAKNASKDLTPDIIQAALDLAAEKGWTHCSLADIAGRVDIKESELRLIFPDKSDILCAFNRQTDEAVQESMNGALDENMSARDRLFDVMMERFDVLNDHRDGLCAILNAVKCDPKQAINGLPHFGRSMQSMLQTANIDADGFMGAAKTFGLLAIYLDTLRTWKQDDSPDMGKTMAALDKNLERAESFIGMCESREMPKPDFMKRK
jgi:ubiquinone biosynthesis protein COQ9